MRQPIKSNIINYTRLYNILIFCIIFSFMYIVINLFFTYLNIYSLLCLILGGLYLIIFIFTKKQIDLILSLISTTICIGLSIIYLYL